MGKRYLEVDVHEAALSRLRRIYSDFPRVYLSFSAGKDSGVLFHLALRVAREFGRPLDVLFIDLEAQYRHTIEFAERCLAIADVHPAWICLPLNLRNAVSQIRPNWTCWDADARDIWVRGMPSHPAVVNESRLADLGWGWFRKGMEFERFIVDYAYQFGGGERTCCLIGVRATESLHRYLSVARDGIAGKPKWADLNWTTRIRKDLYNAYPIYDWLPEDVWGANGRFGWDYNRIYDLFYKAGVPMKDMRICQPYGDDQRRGLYLFKMLEHETWAKVVARVEGANYGQRYVHDHAMAERAVVRLPEGHTHRSYAEFLLGTMPPPLAANYRDKIAKFLAWWAAHGTPEIPDAADHRLETKKQAPSWRRICKMILKNDMYAKSLSFSITKRDKERQYEMIVRHYGDG